ncbi:amidohydrolase [Amylibacter marinus]|uniref:Amidohydrolase n=1 Tax=Amylibacter marinus TaxID=1475483 RepID=A0ABQ5VVU9_9RHOB|nr:carbon-nitrogen hydrolase family protein [Amylibacter marinus]GLQ35562.1 amidohydrolase [Amylibacter marinus]
MRVGVVQLCSSDDPAANLPVTSALIQQAIEDGADFITTPEVTNIVSTSRKHQRDVLCHMENDPTLAALRAQAAQNGVWILIGSLALKTDDADGRFANRSILVDPQGAIRAQYDKIHMFDVAVSAQETYAESSGYRPGDQPVVADMGAYHLGMTICYDLRFSALYRDLAQAGATVISVPAAMSPITGPAHIETLLRARAIETGCYVISPAQAGHHAIAHGRARETWGHSMAIDPWGQVIDRLQDEIGFFCFDLDPCAVEQARSKIPVLKNERSYKQPKAV